MAAITSASPYAINERLEALRQDIKAISETAQTLETRLRTHSTIEGELPKIHTRIADCYTRVQNELQTHMASCTKDGSMLDGYDACFFEASALHDNVLQVFKRLVHCIRTIAPEYVFVTPETMASPRIAFASLLAENKSSAPAITACLKAAGLTPDTLQYRSILGDGNCFYTSIAAHILDSGQVMEFFEKLPIGELPFSPKFLASVIQFLLDSKADTEWSIHETNYMMQFVRVLRELAAHELLSKPQKYEGQIRLSLAQEFPKEEAEIWTEPAYEKLVDRYTREMGKEASFMTIVALSNLLELPVLIHQVGNAKPLASREAPPIDPLDPHTIHLMKTGEHYYLLHTTPGSEPERIGGGSGASATIPSAPVIQAASDTTPHMTAHFEAPIDVGMGNRLVLVGEGTIIRDGNAVDLSWDSPATNGIPLNCSSDGKLWSLDVEVLVDGQCKICLVEASGKVKWSTGSNKPLKQGARSTFPPKFE